MPRYVNKPKKTLSLKRLIGTLALTGLLVYFGVTFIQQQATMAQQQQQIKQSQRRLEQLKRDNENLGERVEYQQSEDYIEYLARKILGWVKPGDVKFVPKE